MPPPRLHLVRDHGVLAPNAADRDRIVPKPRPQNPGQTGPCSCAAASAPAQRAYRLSWSQLLARVFLVDLVDTTVCPACGGPMKIVAALTDPHSIRTYLEGVGRPSRPPPIAAARPEPQLHFDDAA